MSCTHKLPTGLLAPAPTKTPAELSRIAAVAQARCDGARDLIAALQTAGQLSRLQAEAAYALCEPLQADARRTWSAYMDSMEGHVVVAEARVIHLPVLAPESVPTA